MLLLQAAHGAGIGIQIPQQMLELLLGPCAHLADAPPRPARPRGARRGGAGEGGSPDRPFGGRAKTLSAAERLCRFSIAALLFCNYADVPLCCYAALLLRSCRSMRVYNMP